MKWISICVVSDRLAVCESHKISFRIVKSRLCSVDGRLFTGERAPELPILTYMRAWRSARRLAFTESVAASPLAATPYALRHACVSTWLNGGVPAPQVAAWAGHSVEVLLKIYAKCIEGQDDLARQRVIEALGHRRG